MRAFLLALAATLCAAPAAAQGSNFALADAPPQARAPGWTFTPGFAYQGAWDDNVLLRGNGEDSPSDFMHLVNPRGDLSYVGKHSELTARYDGAFSFFRDLGAMDSYDQHLVIDGRRALTPHIALWVNMTGAPDRQPRP